MKYVSVVINTYNRRHYLERLLHSIQYQRYPYYEVVCVQGPSTDGTEELLQQWKGKIRLASCPVPNLSMSRNIGIKASCGDIICFIDDDAVPEPNWLGALVTAYDDPTVGAVGGYIRDHTGVTYQARYQVCDRFADCYSFDAPEVAIIEGKAVQDWGTDYYTALTGTNCSFRRDVLVELGGYDETFAYFLDETDVLLPLREAGYTITCLDGAEVHHKYAPSCLRTEEKIAKTLYYPIRSKVYFALRHALPQLGLSVTIKRLDAYIDHVSAAQAWLYKSGKIDKMHCDALQRDIEQGRKDGIKLAFSVGAPYTKDTSFFATAESFHCFPQVCPPDNVIKICFISQDYTPEPNGGIGVWVSTLARQMAALGHEVTVITRARIEHASVDYEEGVWVHRIMQRHMPERPYAAPPSLPQIVYDWSASAYGEVMRVALTRGLDCISAPIWDVEGVVAHCAGTLPVFVSLHTSYGLALPSKPFWNTNKNYLNQHVLPVIEAEQRLLLESPLIIANSRAIVDDIEACYRINLPDERVRLVPHGMPDIQGTPTPLKSDDEERTIVNLLFVGRFEERKGIDVLLDILPELVTTCPQLHVHLAGNSTISDFWENFYKKYSRAEWFGRVCCHGFVNPEKLEALYATCDIFVAPSRYESFGLIYLEAMRYSKACVGTTAGGIPEVVCHEENGLLVPPGDGPALYQALKRLVDDVELRCKMGKRSRELYEKKFTDIEMARAMEKVLKDFFQYQCDFG